MAYTITGKIHEIGKLAVRENNGKSYYSRTLTLEQPKFDTYSGEKLSSNFPQLEVSGQELCGSVADYSKGAVVDVDFFVKGFNYEKDGEKRNFTKLGVISVKPHTSRNGSSDGLDEEEEKPAKKAEVEEDVDDLPFD